MLLPAQGGERFARREQLSSTYWEEANSSDDELGLGGTEEVFSTRRAQGCDRAAAVLASMVAFLARVKSARGSCVMAEATFSLQTSPECRSSNRTTLNRSAGQISKTVGFNLVNMRDKVAESSCRNAWLVAIAFS